MFILILFVFSIYCLFKLSKEKLLVYSLKKEINELESLSVIYFSDTQILEKKVENLERKIEFLEGLIRVLEKNQVQSCVNEPLKNIMDNFLELLDTPFFIDWYLNATLELQVGVIFLFIGIVLLNNKPYPNLGFVEIPDAAKDLPKKFDFEYFNQLLSYSEQVLYLENYLLDLWNFLYVT